MKALLLSILALLVVSAKGQKDVAYWYNKGYDAAVKHRAFKKACVFFTEAIALDPKNANIYSNRGSAKLDLKNYKAAMLDFETASKLEPKEQIYKNNLQFVIRADSANFTKADTSFTLDSLLLIVREQYRMMHPAKYFALSVNLLQLPINELGIYGDFLFAKKHSIGFGIGQIYANDAFKVNFLSGDQGTYPGTVWTGFVGRINYKNYFTASQRCYVAIQFIYKSLNYKDQTFVNQQHDDSNYFVRSETASVFGLDGFFGYHLTRPQSAVNVELFYGLGIRNRLRNYSTISSVGPNWSEPVGSFVLNQTYLTCVLGLKIGFKAFY